MRTASVLCGLLMAAGSVTSSARAQAFTFELRAPEQVLATESFVVEVWGRYADGGAGSALAGFVGDAIAFDGSEGVASVGGVPGGSTGDSGMGLAVYPGYLAFTETVQADGANVVGAQGGQLANISGVLNPGIQTGNEALLFSFTVLTAAGFEGTIGYTFVNETVSPTLVWYPDGGSGATVASRVGGVAVLESSTRVVIPSPGVVSAGFGCMLVVCRGRCRIA